MDTTSTGPRRALGLPPSLSLLGLASSLVSSLGLGVGCDAKPAAFSEPMTLGGRVVPAATLEQGRDLYRMHCVSCHGPTGAGDGPAAAALEHPPRDFRTGDFTGLERAPGSAEAGESALPSHEALVERIRSGAPERGMPSWKGMRDEDLSALADYIKTFSPRWADAPASSNAAAGVEA
jgi:mono/diheme cytochrome c family protein